MIAGRSIDWQDIEEGQSLPPVKFDVTYSKVLGLALGSWDFFPGHHDPEYAADQGQKGVYLNTMALAGFLDRIVLGWAGPRWFLQKRAMQIAKSVYAGDTLIGTGTVIGKRIGDGGIPSLEVELAASNQADEPCVLGQATIILPNGNPKLLGENG